MTPPRHATPRKRNAATPGARPTLGDIALRTGLSVATVSRALHRDDSPNVSDQTRERIRDVARELGYRPNLLSRSLVTGRTHTVSYWTFDAFSPYYAEVGRSVLQEGRRRGYSVHLHSTFDPEGGLEAEAAEALALSFDGIIACDVAYEGNRFAERLHGPGVPLVGIGFNHPTDSDYVNIDLEHGATLAVEHLLALGCRRIAHVGGFGVSEHADRRTLVYDTLARAAGRQPEYVPLGQLRRDLAREAVAAHVRAHGVPDAFFCLNDEVAVGCYRGLADVGVEVPRDTLLVGFDGIAETAYHRCPLTTVAAPVGRMCELAWEFLEERLRDPGRPLQRVVLKPELIVRESTRN